MVVRQHNGLCAALAGRARRRVTGTSGWEEASADLFSQKCHGDSAETGSRDRREGFWINISSQEGRHLKQFSTSPALYCRVGIKNQPKSWWET